MRTKDYWNELPEHDKKRIRKTLSEVRHVAKPQIDRGGWHPPIWHLYLTIACMIVMVASAGLIIKCASHGDKQRMEWCGN